MFPAAHTGSCKAVRRAAAAVEARHALQAVPGCHLTITQLLAVYLLLTRPAAIARTCLEAAANPASDAV